MTSPASPSSAIAALRHLIPADTERGGHAYEVDDRTPQVAFAPNDRGEVATLLKGAADAGLTVVPQGSRTAIALGAPLRAYDVALDMRGLQRVVEYVPDDLTLTVEAGCTLFTLQETLAAHGQYLPIDPPPDDHVTVGGLLATARPGAWRGHLPAARDLVLGIEAALPSGELVKSGGRVVKNVTGYDLHRMHTGALGAFGVIVQASFKVAPLPASTMTLAATLDDLHAAETLALRTWNAGLAVRAISMLTREAAAHIGLRSGTAVLIELAGSEAAVARSAIDARALGYEAAPSSMGWGYLRRLHGDAAATVLRLGVPSDTVAQAIEACRTAGALAWGHLASGAVIAHFDQATAATVRHLRATAEAAGGFLQVEAAPVSLREQISPGAPGDAILVAALRDRFDPGRILNRGRWGETL